MGKNLGLLDLVVTAAITGSVYCITLPFVTRGLNAANRAHCQNNLRQIGMAVQQYAMDHREVLAFYGPRFGHCAAVTTSNFLGTRRMGGEPAGGSPRTRAEPFGLGALREAGYLDGGRVFRCAGDKRLSPKRASLAQDRDLTSPGDYQHLYGSYFFRAGRDERCTGVRFAEQGAAIPMSLRNNAPTRAIVTETSGNHGPGVNALFADGRVANIPEVEFKARPFPLVTRVDGKEEVAPAYDADLTGLARANTWNLLDRSQCVREDHRTLGR